MDAQIAKTTQSLTTAAEMRDATMMLMQPSANWEEYLTPAPLSIAIMGELVFISSCNDFSINKNAPNGFKHIRYPDSFRACLMQICNSGWNAFNEAHKNMDQIRIQTGTVPCYMKKAVQILFNASDDVIEAILPLQLESIRAVADDCVVLAGSVEKKFSDVIALIHELLEACVNARCFYGEELEKVKLKLEESKLREKTAAELNEQSRKVMDSMAKQMEEAQHAYKESMDSLPSGWEMIGMDVVEGITSSMTAMIHGVTSLWTVISKKAGGSGGSAEHRDVGGEDVDEITKIAVCCKSGEILNLATLLKQYVKDDQIDWKNLYDQKNQRTNAAWLERQFTRIRRDLEETPKNKLRAKALALCEAGVDVCKQLEEYRPGEGWNKKKTKALIKKVEKLNVGALAFDSGSKRVLRSPALAPKPPMMFKAQSGGGGGSEHQSASQRATDNARFRVEQSREQLAQTRQSYEKCAETCEKNQRELNDILVEMQGCKIAEIDFDTKIKMLVKGLDAMGRVKEQWEAMVRFFQMVSNMIKTSLGKTLRDFVQTCDASKKLTYDKKLFTKDLLYTYAFQASNIAGMVHMISGTYTQVSDRYLMDRVSSLGKLMAMDPESPGFLRERLNLQDSCKEAQDGIRQLVVKHRQEFERKTDGRLAKIEGELKAVLPAAPPRDTERIKEIVQAGFDAEEGGEEDYY